VELIAEQGFSATTVDDIALRAKVAKGTSTTLRLQDRALRGVARHGIGLLTDDFRAAVAGLAPRDAVAALVGRSWSTSGATGPSPATALEMWRTNRECSRPWCCCASRRSGSSRDDPGRRRLRDLPADLDVRVASSALFGVGLVVAVDWLVFQPERPIETSRDRCWRSSGESSPVSSDVPISQLTATVRTRRSRSAPRVPRPTKSMVSPSAPPSGTVSTRNPRRAAGWPSAASGAGRSRPSRPSGHHPRMLAAACTTSATVVA